MPSDGICPISGYLAVENQRGFKAKGRRGDSLSDLKKYLDQSTDLVDSNFLFCKHENIASFNKLMPQSFNATRLAFVVDESHG